MRRAKPLGYMIRFCLSVTVRTTRFLSGPRDGQLTFSIGYDTRVGERGV